MNTVSAKLEGLLSRNSVCILFLLVFCFASFALPLLAGLPSGFDMLTDIRFASALKDAMLAGELFPGWANDNFGFGSIGIRFYPPIAFYVLAFTEMLTADWFWALWANLFFWMFLGSIGMFVFVKEWGTPAQGLIAGIGYAIVPQHLSEVFQFFLFAEFAAWGLIPFCFLFLTRICRNGKWIDVVLFAIAYSLLVLTHLPTTIIVSFCLPIYVLVVMDWRNYRPVFTRLAAAVALTVAATLFRWVTIIAEFDWLQHNDSKWANGYYQYAAWLFPNTLTARSQFLYVLSSWLFDIAIVMTVALIIPALVYLFKTRTEKASSHWKIIAASAGVTTFAFFMLSKPSQFIWDALPFLQKLQFPWRWMSMVSFAAVVAFALSVPRLLDIVQGRRRFVAYPALALVVTIILFNITQIIIPSAPIPVAEFSEVEKKVAEEPMFEGWWPVWAKEGAFETPERVTAGARFVDTSKWESLDRAFTIQEGEPVKVRVATFYYPYWKATVNDKPTTIEPDINGAILIPTSGEYSKVRLTFEEPGRNKIAKVVSLATWIVLFVVAGILCRKKETAFLS
jgi:uncharacterized membrane protein